MKNNLHNRMETATLGGGCFWCTEAIYQQLKGVKSVTSGYSGGTIRNPAYREVCTGRTGHAEVIQIQFDPDMISFKEILRVFFSTHDPTTLNRQGNDVGTQYRSVIFYHNENQKETALSSIQQLNKATIYNKPIVTEIRSFTNFYPAEDDHKNYFQQHPDQAYCHYVILPKLEKFQEIAKDLLKD